MTNLIVTMMRKLTAISGITIRPRHTWQYWYEGISSDFGDYGWMEWDKDEKEWYIEEYDGEWIILPEEYDRSRLWHVE